MEVLKLPSDGSCKWAGIGDYQLISPNESIAADVKYIGESPHGDSYHSLSIRGKKFQVTFGAVCLHFRLIQDIKFVAEWKN